MIPFCEELETVAAQLENHRSGRFRWTREQLEATVSRMFMLLDRVQVAFL